MEKKYILDEISPKHIAFNRDNPRGESADEIRNDKEFEQLKDSVAQFGVLVPIVVHENKRGSFKYVLVDGERRLRAARAANLKVIPAHIARSKDTTDERIQAFHIHMLRKQWKQVATARAYRQIKNRLKKMKVWDGDKELLQELRARTGCTKTQLENYERAIRYSDDILKEVDDGKVQWSHLIQFEASFVEKLKQQYPKLISDLGEQKVRDVLVEKARQKVIGPTRELIHNMLPVFHRAKSKDEKKVARRLFKRFIDKPDCPPDTVKLEYEKVFPPAKDQLELANEILKAFDLLNPMIEQIDVTQIISFPQKALELKKAMEALKKVVNTKSKQLGKLIE